MSNSQAPGISMPAVAVAADPRGTALVTVPAGQAEQIEFLSTFQDGAVVLVGTAGDPGCYHALNALARMGAGPRVRILACTASPTLLAITAAVMAAGRFGPGDAVEVLRSLKGVTTTVAIVGSVSRLESPVPSLLQHISSVLPGSTFVIDLPGQTVHTGLGALSRLSRMHNAALVLASPDDPQSLAWRERLVALAPDAPQFAADGIASATVPWRTRTWAEVTGLAVSVEQLAERLRAHLARQVCPSCAQSISGMVCPMCGIVCDTGLGAAGDRTAASTGAVPIVPAGSGASTAPSTGAVPVVTPAQMTGAGGGAR